MEHVTKEEFMDSQQRLHKRVDQIQTSSANIDKAVGIMTASVSAMKVSSDKIHDAIFGNGKPGIVTRLSNAFVHIKIQYALIFFTSVSIIGGAIFIIRDHFKG